jgi:hypothetical protein
MSTNVQLCHFIYTTSLNLQYFKLFNFLKRIAVTVLRPTDEGSRGLYSLDTEVDGPYIVDVLMFEVIL